MIPWESCVLWLGYPIQNGVWPDISRYDNDGVITGAFWKGDSLEFDGIDDYVNCGNNSILRPANLTFEALINLEGNGTGATPCIASTYDIVTAANGWVLVYDVSSGTFRFYVYDGAWRIAVGNDTIVSGIHHLVGMYSGTEVSIWVDGVKQTITDTASSIAYGTTNMRTHIANYHTMWFEGGVFLARLYNKGFTAQQVKESYEQTYKLI